MFGRGQKPDRRCPDGSQGVTREIPGQAAGASYSSYRSWWRTHSMVKDRSSSSRPFGTRSR